LLPPVFFEVPLSADLDAAKRQACSRNFDASLVRGISSRCRYGFPQVTVCDPLRKGRPFPTVFWLSCPFLSRKVDGIESAGGVSELGRRIERDGTRDWRVFNLEYVLFRVFLLGPERSRAAMEGDPSAWRSLTATGVGGIRPSGGVSVKCLHLQAASMIGLGWHPGEDWLCERIGVQECDDPLEWQCATG